MACLELCRGDPDCLWFTYKGEDDMCTLLESCEDVDKDCENCVSGQKQCADRPGTLKHEMYLYFNTPPIIILRFREDKGIGCWRVDGRRSLH